jgi:hypothetical protein
MTLLTAAQWFMVSGALMFVFGVGLLALVITGARRRRRRPVREITRIRLHELSLDTRPGPYGPHGAIGFEVVADRWAAAPRTNPRNVPARTVVMPRVPPTTRRPQ